MDTIMAGAIAAVIVESFSATITLLFSRMEDEVEEIFMQHLTLTLQTN